MDINKFLVMDPNDNCATTVTELIKGETVKIEDKDSLIINQDIPFGHKFALKEIKKGEKVLKYGEIIAVATGDINPGDWIHTHNIKSYYLEALNNE